MKRAAPLVLAFALALPTASAQLKPSLTYSPPSATQGTVSSTATPNTQWETVMGNALWFYDAQRSGNLDEGAYGNRVSWRNSSATADGSDWNLDLSGGWYDAGDYIKATFPLGYTLFALAWGGLSYGPAYDSANQTAYLDGTLRWGFDWMMKAHPSDDQLFVQVGSGDVDAAYWGGDNNLPNPRTAYPVNSSFPGTDVWASTATAFAIGSMLYSGVNWNTSSNAHAPASLANQSYAAELLKHAESLYKTANDTSPMSTFSHSVPAIGAAYTSSGWGDDLVAAGLALAAATNNSAYYADAYANYQKYALSGKQSVWNWDSRTPAAYLLFSEIAAARPGIASGAGLQVNQTGWQKETEAYLDAIVNDHLQGGSLTKGGLLFYDGDSDEASLNPALGAATLLVRYAPLATSGDKTAQYNQYALDQLNYVLGNNPMSAVYMVGLHPNSPQNPHSALAAGGTNINDIRNDPPTEAYVLYGAIVGGPLKSDKFWDWRDDWAQCEVALDYNANIPTLAAWQLLNSSVSDPYYVSVQAGTYSIPKGKPCDAALTCSKISNGAIAGIVIGVVLGVLLILGLIWWWKRNDLRRWRRSRKFAQ